MLKTIVGCSAVTVALFLSAGGRVAPATVEGGGCTGATGTTMCVGTNCTYGCASYTDQVPEGQTASATQGTSQNCSKCTGKTNCGRTSYNPAVPGC